MNKGSATRIAAILGTLALTQAAWADAPPPPAAAEPLYATVNGKPITQKDFHSAYANYLREKFYHRQVPEDRLAEAKQDVSNRLVERILLLDDAKRRGLAADEKRIAQTIAEYDARYAGSPMWQSRRDSLLPGLREQLGEQDLLRQMNEAGHAIQEPTDAAVREFYNARIELFTEPEKMRLHTILLKVEPSAPKAVWDAARDEAARLVTRLRAGKADFSELASLHSRDPSADKGGDMGYLHRGMIPESVQVQIDERPLGSISDPIDVLEGVAIFRLDERIPSKQMAFDDVAARARDLLKRELTTKAWNSFITDLRKSAIIQILEPVTQPQPGAKN